MATKKNAFGDVRSDEELLASPRPPKETSYIKRQLNQSWTKTKSNGVKIGKEIKSGASLIARLLPSQAVQKVLSGRVGKAFSTVSASVRRATLGVIILEELDPRNLKRPLTEGLSTAATVAGKNLAETAFKSLLKATIGNVPVAKGIPVSLYQFKSLKAVETSPRTFSNTGAAPAATPASVVGAVSYVPVGNATSVLVAQRGLLQDEILYRMTLVAEHLYAPMAQWVGQNGLGYLRILEGFRAENTGTSSHERGEAIDVMVGSGTWNEIPNTLRLARWIRDTLVFDQLVLCYGKSNVWLHVSLTPDTNRFEVSTKLVNDVCETGLVELTSYTEQQRNADINTVTSQTNSVTSTTTWMRDRQQRTGLSVNTTEVTSGFAALRASATPGLTWPDGGNSDTSGYVANNTSRSLVIQVATELLNEPTWRVQLMTDGFVEEMLQRLYARGVPSSGTGAVGKNAKRGGSAISHDALAILNPTGCMGFGSMDTHKRVQIVDFITAVESDNPQPQWLDVTEVSWEVGGGFVGLSGMSSTTQSSRQDTPTPADIEQAVRTELGATGVVVMSSQDMNAWSAGERTQAFSLTVKSAQTLATRFSGARIGLQRSWSGATYPGWSGQYADDIIRVGDVGYLVTAVSDNQIIACEPVQTDATGAWVSPFTGEA